MRRHSSLLYLVCLLLLITVVLNACGGKPNIVGRWQITGWAGCYPGYIEFFESGIADWCDNLTQRLWRMKAGGQLETTPGIWGSARIYVYQVKITDDTMVIIDEQGNRAIGTRTR